MGMFGIVVLIYIVVGSTYATHLTVKKVSPWYLIPINILGGPVVLIYLLLMTLLGKKIKIG